MQEQPNAVEMEQSLICAALRDKALAEYVVDNCEKDDFSTKFTRACYTGICELVAKDITPELLTLTEWFKSYDYKLSAAQILFIDDVRFVSDADYYVRTLRGKRKLRHVLEVCGKLTKAVKDEKAEDVDKLLEEFAIVGEQEDRATMPKPIKDGLMATYESIIRASAKEESGLYTGYAAIDDMTGGLRGSQLIILAARPAMGKTALAVNIAQNMAKAKVPIVFFSLEMSTEQLCMRMVSVESQVNLYKLKRGTASAEEYSEVADAVTRLAKTPMFIDDTAMTSPADMLRKCKRLNKMMEAKNQKKIGAVFVDYLQLVKPTEKAGNREQEVSSVTRAMKLMAKELDVPVVLLSQLSRASEKRDGKRPVLSDLRESGAIEQDADIVMFIHREGYYSGDTSEMQDADIIFAKQREGATGTVKMMWIASKTRFKDKEKERNF